MIDRYISHGWHVFPLRARSKEPLTEHGWKDATTDPSIVASWAARWPGCNWGIATGPSSLLVVDLDGAEGINSWDGLTKRYATPQTLMAYTGGGGRHLVYADPERRGRNTTRKLAAGIDTRGQGGYIVAPPSTHPNGTRYRWERHPIHPIPTWVIGILTPRRPATASPPRGAISLGTTDYGNRCLEGILNKLQGASQGTLHDLNYWAAVRAGQLCAAGHVTASAFHDVLHVAQSARQDTIKAERDTKDGWDWGIANPGLYQPAQISALAPRALPPRAYAPR